MPKRDPLTGPQLPYFRMSLALECSAKTRIIPSFSLAA